MDSGSTEMFRPVNQRLAHVYWYLVAALFASALLLKIVAAFESWSRSVSQPYKHQCDFGGFGYCLEQPSNFSFQRQRSSRRLSLSHPTRPRNVASQAYATTLAIFRELTYPQVVHLARPGWEWLSPPPLGQSLVIVTYWIIITLFLTANSVVHDAYYWERVGFRAAWVSVTQVPLIYLLAGKVNIPGILLGSSYMDLNWLHAWVSRTLFITATIHGSFFLREWIRADFVRLELEMMPMVKYGFGLWAVLAWNTITSLIPLQRLCYEFFVFQHAVSAGVFLWLLHVHVPAYASYNVWMAVAFVLSGRIYRSCISLYQSIRLQRKTVSSIAGRILGRRAELMALAGQITVLTIHDVGFSWKPGQHILLWCPALGPFESHPFTIANTTSIDGDKSLKKVQLIIRARSGFTRRLLRRANTLGSVTAFLTGPFGNLPTWNTYETLVLISASTGASFTLPILESVLNDPCCVTRIEYLVLVRHESHLDGYISRLQAAVSHPRSSEVSLHITVAVTAKHADPVSEDDTSLESKCVSACSSFNDPMKTTVQSHATTTDRASATTFDKVTEPKPSMKTEESKSGIEINDGDLRYSTDISTAALQYTSRRPNLTDFMRKPIEASAGETSVVVCGGTSLTSTVRNCVASLSDERAVHKGTGAQGIHLHVEGFGL